MASVFYCLHCAEKILINNAFKDKEGDFYHFRILQVGKPEVVKCGPVDMWEEDPLERDDDESEEDVT
jgi:hypothetical protein